MFSFNTKAALVAISLASTSAWTAAIAVVANEALDVTVAWSAVFDVFTAAIFVSTYVFTAFWVGNKTSLVPKVVVADLLAVFSFKAKAELEAVSLASTSAWTAAIAVAAAEAFAVTVAWSAVFDAFIVVILVST